MRPTAFLRLIRPVNCFMMGFAVVVGAAMAAGVSLADSWLAILYGFLTAFTLTGSAMAANDYFDREIDAINEPDRPIPSGGVTPEGSVIFSAFLASVGLAAAFLTNLSCFALSIFALIVMLLYSARYKRSGLFGNILVSASVALPFIYGGLAIKESISTYSLLFALMAFLSNTGREVTKGIVDIGGDRAKGIRTLAVLRGAKPASVAAAAFYLSAVSISAIPVSLNLVTLWYVPPIILADLGFVVSSRSLMREPSREKSRREKNRALIWMAMALVGFLAGNLF